MIEGAALLLEQLCDGDVDAAVADWLRTGFLRWLHSDGSLTLPACLHLHARPAVVRIGLRDRWLREAARDPVEALSLWRRAKRLRVEVASFESRSWPSWRREREPPWERCSRVQACLFYAFRAGAAMPQTTEQFRNILAADNETKSRDHFATALRKLA
jgi:hypothetical protein